VKTNKTYILVKLYLTTQNTYFVLGSRSIENHNIIVAMTTFTKQPKSKNLSIILFQSKGFGLIVKSVKKSENRNLIYCKVVVPSVTT